MRELYRKISRWFFLNIEAPIAGYELPTEEDWESVSSGVDIMFGMIIDVLYNGKEDEYKAMIENIEKDKNEVL